MAHDVFISYSSKDKDLADAACAVLERNGLRVWIAPRDILPGMGWGASLVEAINQARLMVLVFSGAANASPQIEREVERAIHRGLPVIPFRIEDVPPSGALEYFINAPHWLDAFGKPPEQSLGLLAEVVKKVIEVKYGRVLATAAEPKEQMQSSALMQTLYEAQRSPHDLAPGPEPGKAEETGAALLDRDAFVAPAAAISDREKSSKRPEKKLNRGALVAFALGGLVAAGGLIYFNQRPPAPVPHAENATPGPAPTIPAPTPVSPVSDDAREAVANGREALAIKDYPQAMVWFRKAADQGNATAQDNIGWLYQNGWGVAQDYAQAMIWYRKSADQGDATAQGNIGFLYQNGWGVAQDYAQAMVWYRKAANRGNAFAQKNIGWLYQNGWGVAQDYAQATIWYRKAADQGNAAAQNNIGWLYQNGLGVEKDIDQAVIWYRLAAEAGSKEAKAALKQLGK